MSGLINELLELNLLYKLHRVAKNPKLKNILKKMEQTPYCNFKITCCVFKIFPRKKLALLISNQVTPPQKE